MGKHWCSSKQRKTNELLHWIILILEILFETITIKWEKKLVVIMTISLSQIFKNSPTCKDKWGLIF
jgi:hypothetical protein